MFASGCLIVNKNNIMDVQTVNLCNFFNNKIKIKTLIFLYGLQTKIFKI
jgi:hypothetical protein